MAGNRFGNKFSITTFGESHGEGIGGVIDGCPSGIILDFDFIQSELDRRKPGQSAIVTQRKEPDEVQFLKGKQPERQLAFLFQIPIKNQTIIRKLKIHIDLLTQILFMIKNMVLEIIAVVVVVLPEKLQLE